MTIRASAPAAGLRAPRSVGAVSYLVADVAATALCGFEGALAAANAHFDLFGIAIIGFATALVGGILRDVLLGDLPPAAFRSPARIVAALLGSAAAFLHDLAGAGLPREAIQFVDAGALALFAVTGAEKAAARGSNLWVVGLLGTMTAAGGGIVRDVLLNRVPLILTADVYATAAAAGSVAVGIALKLRVRPLPAMAAGFVVCLGLRILAILLHWELPRLAR